MRPILRMIRHGNEDAVRDFHAAVAKDRRDARRMAVAFERACASGEVDQFHTAVDGLFHLGGWRLAMMSGTLPATARPPAAPPDRARRSSVRSTPVVQRIEYEVVALVGTGMTHNHFRAA
jgi:hypothetical protein